MTKEKMQKNINLVLGVIMMIMVIGALWQVFSRYVIGQPNTVTDELLRYLLIWSVMIGSVAGFITGDHMALTLLTGRFKTRPRLLYSIKAAIDALLAALFAGVLLPGGLRLMMNGMQQLSPILQVPMGYIYVIIPLMATAVGLIKLRHLAYDIKKLKEVF
jgi:TRAP-type C4-dicarboxylate transport system permease small subunit